MLSFEENLFLLEEEASEELTKFVELEEGNIYSNMSIIVGTIDKITEILMNNYVILESDYNDIKVLQETCLKNVGDISDQVLKYEKT